MAGDLQKQLVPLTLREAKGATGLAAGHAEEVSQQVSNRMHERQCAGHLHLQRVLRLLLHFHCQVLR